MSKDKGEVEKGYLKRINKSAERGKKRLDMIYLADKKEKKRRKVRIEQYIPDHKLHDY